MPTVSTPSQSQLAACNQLNSLALVIHQPLADPDLALTLALEATRVFVPDELVSVIDAILDGYAIHAARVRLEHDLRDGLPLGALSFSDHVTKGEAR